MKYHFKVHKEGDGFWAECLEIPGCVTQADSRDELTANMEDAINTLIQEPEGSNYLAPLPNDSYKTSHSIAEVKVDPKIAMGFWLRYNRIKNGMTQEDAARKLGMKNIFSYQRLEHGCNTSLGMLSRLADTFPLFKINAVFN
jgi:predicted RNase H-like HicB family nuclease/DNA-binding XRE family transcriptional regulator